MLTDPNLKAKVNELWDRFWSGGISNPLTAIEQMSYLICLKWLEDMDTASAAGFLINAYLHILLEQNTSRT